MPSIITNSTSIENKKDEPSTSSGTTDSKNPFILDTKRPKDSPARKRSLSGMGSLIQPGKLETRTVDLTNLSIPFISVNTSFL